MNISNEPVETYGQQGLGFTNYIGARKLYPILKWAGGKEQELKYIIPNLPFYFNNYYEPFVGGGAVYTSVQAKEYFINDKSVELITLYRSLQNDNRDFLFRVLDEISCSWEKLTGIAEENSKLLIDQYKKFSAGISSEKQLDEFIVDFIKENAEVFKNLVTGHFGFDVPQFSKEIRVNMFRKLRRMSEIEKIKNLLSDKDLLDNIETSLKSAYYMYFRFLYNNSSKLCLSDSLKTALFLFIRNFAYSGMFRYNSSGDFNVPYGGIGYNRKNFRKKINYLRTNELHSLLSQTNISNLDFEDFMTEHQPQKNDFIFLDPPYDSEFSTYAQNEFLQDDQIRLSRFLLHSCKAKWMMIIKNTDFILNLYNGKGLSIRTFDKTYLVSFMNRNDKNTEHLIITNY